MNLYGEKSLNGRKSERDISPSFFISVFQNLKRFGDFLGQDKAFYQKIKFFIPKYVPLLHTYVHHLRTPAIDPPPLNSYKKVTIVTERKTKKDKKKDLTKSKIGARLQVQSRYGNRKIVNFDNCNLKSELTGFRKLDVFATFGFNLNVYTTQKQLKSQLFQ